MQHLLDIESLTQQQIQQFLKDAKRYLKHDKLITTSKTTLKNKTIFNLFFENSTRTLYSFEIAAKRLGAHVINFNAKHSSVNKGETLHDTILNLTAMGADCFVVRHPEAGSAQNIAKFADNQVHVINGGDGIRAHPTQALLDLLTIQQHKRDFKSLSVAIIGDIKHSRVVHSLTIALKKMNCSDIRVTGPEILLPKTYDAKLFDTLEKAIKNVDVIVMLRIQNERLQDIHLNKNEYSKQWCLTKEKLTLAKSDAIVMHPGPMNRGIEISSEVADSTQSVIFEQPRNGVALRMAVLENLLIAKQK